MKYRIEHRTDYRYSRSVAIGYNKACLTPLTTPFQKVHASLLRIEPRPEVFDPYVDVFGNTVLHFAIQRPHAEVAATAVSEVEVFPRANPDPAATPTCARTRERVRQHADGETLDACEFVFESPYIQIGRSVAEYAAPSFADETPVLAAALDLMRRMREDFEFAPKATTLTTSLVELLENRKGVCQDFSHLMIACLRSAGLAARYVSGYLRTLPPPGKEKLKGIDFSHAWIAVFVPGSGWIELDPTNDLICATDHVSVAVGRDYDDVSPLRGVVVGGGRQTLDVSVDVAVIEPPGQSQSQTQTQTQRKSQSQSQSQSQGSGQSQSQRQSPPPAGK